MFHGKIHYFYGHGFNSYFDLLSAEQPIESSHERQKPTEVPTEVPRWKVPARGDKGHPTDMAIEHGKHDKLACKKFRF